MKEINSTLLFIMLLLFAFGASRFFGRYAEKISFLKNLVFCTLGVLIGPSLGFSILKHEALDTLGLLTHFILGLIAFNTGLKTFRYKSTPTFIRKVATDSFLQFFTIGLIFAAIGFIYISQTENIPLSNFQGIYHSSLFNQTILFAFTLGVMSLFTSGVSHFYEKKDIKLLAPVFSSISQFSTFFEIMALASITLTLFGINLFISHSESFETVMIRLLYLLFAPILGALFVIFIGKENNDDRMTIATLGGVLFSTGIGIVLTDNYLFFPFLMGLTISKMFKNSELISNILSKIEDPTSILLIILFSASIQRPTLMTVGICFFFILLRYFYLLKFKDYIIGSEISRHNLSIKNFGRGFIAQDALLLGAAALMGEQLEQWANPLLFIAIVSIVMNEFLGAGSVKTLLIDSDELKNY